MTGLFQGRYDDLAPGLRRIAQTLERREHNEQLAGGSRHDDPPLRPPTGIAWELAKIVLPAALAFGGAWMSMHDQITDLRGDVKELSHQVNDIKQMLGIGVFQGSRR